MTKNIFIYLVVILLVGAAAWLFIQKARKSSDISVITGAETTATPTAAVQETAEENWVKLPSGLQILDITVGPGKEAREGDVVSAHYSGTLENGTKFDSSYDRGQPFSFVLGGGMVIKGWDLGIVGMKVGGKRKLIIPPSLAYGDKEVGGVIPAGSTLIFEVELMGTETQK